MFGVFRGKEKKKVLRKSVVGATTKQNNFKRDPGGYTKTRRYRTNSRGSNLGTADC